MRTKRWLLLMLIAAFQIAGAQGYPSKPVRLLVPYPAGGPVDAIARILAQHLSLGENIVVDSRSGAGGSIGAEVVARSAPDGYTLLIGNSGPLDYIRSGRLRAIALTSSKPSPVLPQLPRVADSYPGFELVTWMGIFLPAGTAEDIRAKLQGEFQKALHIADARDRIVALGNDVVAGSGADLAALIDRELKLYARIIKSAGMQPQ